MELKIITTSDGSHTISVAEMNEHYHSIYGAMSESLHVFINAGLKFSLKQKKNINILEIGFGTGLNAVLTYLELLNTGIVCEYTTIEAFPINENVFRKLNYPQILNIPNKNFLSLHECAWNRKIEIYPGFVIQKRNCKAQDMILPELYFDLVYFDAFSPAIQPEMWTEEIFLNVGQSMKPGAVLTTYSTKGSVKKALKETGFDIEKIPGPAGKREILRAVKL